MVQSSTEKNVMCKGAAAFAGRMCLLVLVVSSALLVMGCATMTSDEQDVFYSGWGNPKSNPLIP
jgi:hypothetical protein